VGEESRYVAHQATTWVICDRISTGLDRLVLHSLAAHAGWSNGRWECWPSIETIAWEANTTRLRSVQESLARLETAGLIKRTVNAAPDERIPGNRRPSLYVLNMPDHGVADSDTPSLKRRRTGVTDTDTPQPGVGVTDTDTPEALTGVTVSADRGDGFRRTGVTDTDTQIVSRTVNKQPDPPYPPASGGEVVLAAFEQERTAALQALTGGAYLPGPQIAAAMAAGGWLRLEDVPDVNSAVDAYLASLPTLPYTERRKFERLGRTAIRGGKSPGQFLANLCTANTGTPASMDLGANRAARADLPGMSGMRSKPSVAERGTALYEKRKEAKRRARATNVIDAQSEEVGDDQDVQRARRGEIAGEGVS
jgi:hypothetical protein